MRSIVNIKMRIRFSKPTYIFFSYILLSILIAIVSNPTFILRAQDDAQILPACNITEDELEPVSGVIYRAYNAFVVDITESSVEFANAEGLREYQDWISSAIALSVRIEVAVYTTNQVMEWQPECYELQRIEDLLIQMKDGLLGLAIYTSANFTWALNGEEPPRNFEEARDTFSPQITDGLREYIQVVSTFSTD